ncbi:ABC transporter ATP-binding protein [Kibdelosporangium philippinense]|uniref:ABC transporter ATP-binding protein n=1 Tax=Kibdelosporangium philippinense TaxID=211113 RepID=A0ABS8ZQY7_9PSEU|nr:ABC transporter ATP-binding protein [Kibdelosporangium philippinense]MCE7010139.1 ABC transporter ATP-binding protein [Kibdelosporangium philippinense]
MITTKALTKRFGSIVAVNSVDLDVQDGDRYGFLGPNGSGKTTLVRMLLGLVYPTSGEISVLGSKTPAHVLPQIGSMIEGPAAYPHLSGRRNLTLLDRAGSGGARRTRKARIEEVLEQVGLASVDARPVKTYSLGMRQRLGLAAALLRQPRLLILDEPTNGLDPQGIREIRELLTALNESGTTVFLSSHLLSEVEQLCTKVGVVDHGKLVLQEELAALRAPTGRVVVESPDADKIAGMLNGQLDDRDGPRLFIRHADSAELNAWLVGSGVRVSSITAERPSLEQVVLAATGPGADRVDGTA